MHPTTPSPDEFFRTWTALLRFPGGLALDAVPDEYAVPQLQSLAKVPAIIERSYRQGLVLCVADVLLFTAILFWQERLFGIYCHLISRHTPEAILCDLKDFRLGWLFDETVRETGGIGCVCGPLPPEAEGFPLLSVTGANRQRFQNLAKIYDL